MKNIDAVRNKIVSIKNEYLKSMKINNVDAEMSSLSCFRHLMYSKFDITYKKNILKNKINSINFLKQIKNFLYICNFSAINIHGSFSKKDSKKYNTIIFSWSYYSSFFSDGSYLDPYFKIKNKDKKVLWILLHVDKKLPKKIDKNIVIIHPKKINKIFGVLNLLGYLTKLIKMYRLNFLNIYHQLSFDSYLAHEIKNHFIKKEFFKGIKKLYLPLESQTFQNSIIKLAKLNGVKTFGFDHTHNSFPVWNSYSFLSPNFIFVQSKSSKVFYSKYLGWPIQKVKKINSVRTERKNKIFFSNKIFFPIIIGDFEKVYNNLEKLFSDYLSRLKIKPLKVRLHPATKKIKKYKRFEKKIYHLQNNFKETINRNNKKSVSIHIGHVSTIIEALENKTSQVLHVTSSEIFDLLSSKQWCTLKYKQIVKDVFKYSLTKYGDCTSFKQKSSIFKI